MCTMHKQNHKFKLTIIPVSTYQTDGSVRTHFVLVMYLQYGDKFHLEHPIGEHRWTTIRTDHRTSYDDETFASADRDERMMMMIMANRLFMISRH